MAMRIPISLLNSTLLSRQGLLFDLAVFLSNLFLVGPLTSLVWRTGGFHPLFGVFLAAAFASYSLGAWLKRGPLQARMTSRGGPAPRISSMVLFGLLVLMLYGLMAAMLMFACVVFGMGSGGHTWVRITAGLVILALAVLPAALTVRVVMPSAVERERTVISRSRRVELFSNLAIYFTVIVIMAWWEGVFVKTLVGAGRVNPAVGMLLVILVTVPFAMFYLAPRLLFLVEDYPSPWTWPSVLLAMAPLACRIIIG